MLSAVFLGKEKQYFMFPLQSFYIAVCQQITQRTDMGNTALTAEQGKQGVVQLCFLSDSLMGVLPSFFYFHTFSAKPLPCLSL